MDALACESGEPGWNGTPSVCACLLAGILFLGFFLLLLLCFVSRFDFTSSVPSLARSYGDVFHPGDTNLNDPK